MNKLSQQPADQHVRTAALAPEQSFLVQAPAGSGKTGLLTARFLRLLATVEKPEQVLAITFTIPAVAEMRDRVLKALQRAKDHVTPESDQDILLQKLANDVLAHAEQKQWPLLELPTRLNIKTIDALALDIASQVPLLSRLGPSLKPDENAESLYKLAAVRTMRVLESRDTTAPLTGGPGAYEALEAEAAWQLLQHRDNNLSQCVALLAEMLGHRDQWSRHFPMDQAELTEAYLDGTLRPQLEQQLQSYVQRGFEDAAAVWLDLDPATAKKLIDLANHASRCEDAHEQIRGLRLTQMPRAVQEDLSQWLGLAELLLTKAAGWRGQFNKRQGFPTGLPNRKPEIEALVASLAHRTDLCAALHSLRNLPPGNYSPDQWTMIKSLFRLLRRADFELRKMFIATGRTDFIELNLAAIQALTRVAEDGGYEPSSLALAIGEGLEHILVDEFQDTSRTQHQLFRLLISAWRGDGRRTLFFVGDPMQSIYAFRQAEVRLFAKTREAGLGDIRFVPQTLTVNFRSQQSLVDAHNELFPRVFEPQSEVQFNASVGFVESRAGDAIHWHFLRKSGDDGVELEEANEICDAIERYIKDDPSCKIALLLRVKQHGDHVLAELRRRKRRYRAVDLEKLCDRQEVLDLAALTRALLHPADRIAWLSVLRAPWCGLTLASLEMLCGLELRKKTPLPCIPDLLAENAAQLHGEDAVIAARARDLLIPALERRTTTRLPQLVFETWQALGGPDCVNEEQLANIQAFFRLLDDLDQQDIPINASTLNDAMDRLFAPPDPLAPDQIEVMTIHKAKGLTFDIVFVPGMERMPRHEESALLEWIEEDAVPELTTLFPMGPDIAGSSSNLLISPIASSGGKKSPIAEWISTAKKKRSDAELRRLLYVAATRARRYVHFFAAVKEDHGVVKKPSDNSLMGVAWGFVNDIAQRQLDADPQQVFSIAAQAPASGPKQNLVRLPADWLPEMRDTASVLPQVTAAARSADEWPESRGDELEAEGFDFATPIAAGITGRAIGTVVHTLLEQVARNISSGESLAAAGPWLASRTRSIQTLLRMQRVPEPSLARASRSAIDLVQKTLASKTGQWVLASHAGADNEVRISLPAATEKTEQRLDRIFLAGAEPHSSGDSHLWIVDYKTASHGSRGLEEFLEKRRRSYGPKMLAYANALRALRNDNLPVICALYYVALDLLEIVARLD